MKRLFFTFFIALASLLGTLQPAMAADTSTTLSTQGLSAEQVATIQKQIDAARREATPELSMMDKAVELGRVIGSGLVATARELGVAANDFARTDLGKTVMYILIWKYLGQDILGIAVGVPFIIAFCWFGWRLVRRASLERVTVEYTHVPVLFGLFSIKRVTKNELVKKDRLTDSEQVQQLAGYVLMAIGIVVGMNTIF